MGLIEPIATEPDQALIWAKLARLRDAVAQRRSRVTCLRRWSEFVRERDDHRCVDCHSRRNLAAHHKARKSMFMGAEFDTGNGITLCRTCHKEVHEGFNGQPDLSQPVDAQGGEKLQLMERLYSILIDDAVYRGLMNDDLYFLRDGVLQTFMKMQGYDHSASFPGARLEQAYLILAEPKWHVRQAIAVANNFTLPKVPLLPGGMALTFDMNLEGGPGHAIARYIIRTGSGTKAERSS